MKQLMRKIHRWLGLLMALQIIAWMGSGLYFSIFPIETIRGEHLTLAADSLDQGLMGDLVSPSDAWSAVSASLERPGEVRAVALHSGFGATWYRVSGVAGGEPFDRLVDARNGRVMPFLDAGRAQAVAEERLAVPGRVERVELVDEAGPGSEIRGRQLPLWRVSFTQPERLSLYVDGWTGEIVARRTTRWRIFDFLWMLHIMDFEARDDFNTPLLQVAAALGLLVALSGVIFWFMTTSLLRRRGRRA